MPTNAIRVTSDAADWPIAAGVMDFWDQVSYDHSPELSWDIGSPSIIEVTGTVRNWHVHLHVFGGSNDGVFAVEFVVDDGVSPTVIYADDFTFDAPGPGQWGWDHGFSFDADLPNGDLEVYVTGDTTMTGEIFMQPIIGTFWTIVANDDVNPWTVGRVAWGDRGAWH